MITLPVVYFLFKETTQKSLEEIDLLFGERALGALPAEITAKDVPEIIHEDYKGKSSDA